MRTWPSGHPKAGLLKRKRDAILAAARRQFLATGYDATSMESIAAGAAVSIMTLYRHARSKEELFEAVVRIECDPAEAEAGMADLKQMPLRAGLVALGKGILKEILAADRIAILRAVIAETVRFPELGEIAYRGLVDHAVEMVSQTILAHPESHRSAATTATGLGRDFIERLLGDQPLKLLLGASSKPDAGKSAERAEEAADALIAALGAGTNRRAATRRRRAG